jgi:hypothetical protein
MPLRIKQSVIDVRHVGEEPTYEDVMTNMDMINAYNWYNYMCDNDQAKDFVLEHLRDKKIKAMLPFVSKIPAIEIRHIGWNLRMLTIGNKLPEDVQKNTFAKLIALVEAQKKKKEDATKVEAENVISIQERIANRAATLIGDLESCLDELSLTGETEFDANKWFRDQAIKAAVAKKIQEYYKPVYNEVYDAYNKADEDLVYAYRRWKRPKLKAYMGMINDILMACDTFATKVSTSRKPRKKKEKPAAVIVKRMKYLEKSEYGDSAPAKDIIGAQQLWTYNTKNRMLSVYNSRGPAGLSVKGTTIINYDDKLSITKKLRKPEVTVKAVREAGKIQLRKVMTDLTTKETECNGRINSHTILVRIIK